MVEKPKPLFVWEIIRAMSVASQCKLSTISFGGEWLAGFEIET